MGATKRSSCPIRLWFRWVLANAAGELIGLGMTFAIGFGLFAGFENDQEIWTVLLSAVLMTATGALEGLIVGWAQWSVLRRAIQGIAQSAWVAATIIGAVTAWLSGSIPMALASLASDTPEVAEEPPQAVVLLLAAAMGLGAGLVLSVAQWLVLRRHVAGAWQWLPANALAWAAGMPLVFAGVDLAQRTGTVGGGILVMGASIALAGAAAGAIHGVALLRLAAPGALR